MAREYKDSGIEWIGQIPKEWKVGSIKHYCNSIFAGGTPQSNNTDYWDGNIPWIPSGSCKNDVIVSAPKFITQAGLENSSTKLIPSNTTVMAMTGATCSNVGYVTFDTCMNQSVVAYLGNKEKSFSKFLFYLLQGAQEEILTHKTGGAQSGINVDDCKNIKVPFISLLEQQKIANYLDKVCGEVDEMVALQETMIEELKAYKQSVITEAVTKGLNPSVPKRDSGIDWIGEIPEHWILSKAKFFVDITNGCDPKTEGNIPVYGSGASSFKTCGEYKEGPTVLIGRKGATLHIPHYIEGKYWNVDTAFDVKVKNGFDLRYYYYTAICFDYKYYISQTTLPGMAQSSYNNMIIPVPSIEEQCSIASYLDTKCSEIDSLIALKQAKIEELKEYKKSVIYEYVTGKKEVV